MTKQSENFINSDSLSLQSDWTVSKKAAAVRDLQTFTQLCCGDGAEGRGFIKNHSLLGLYVAMAVTGDSVIM